MGSGHPVHSTNRKSRTHSEKPRPAARQDPDGKSKGGDSPGPRVATAPVCGRGTPRSTTALRNLRRICETHLAGRYSIEVVDLLLTPQLAEGDQILAVPTLVRKLPEPMCKIIGDLSKEERVLVGLDVQRAKATNETERG